MSNNERQAQEPVPKRLIPHPAFEPLPDDTVVWRYTDLAKFIWTLSNKALYLCRADLLGDSFEGSVPRANSEEMREWAERRFAEEKRTEYPGGEQRATAWVRTVRQAFIHTCHVNCWTYGPESEAMWRLYCGKDEGVAMRSIFGSLRDSIQDDAVRPGKVRYFDYSKDSLPSEAEWLQPITCKRDAFQHEREVRLVRWLQADTIARFRSRNALASGKAPPLVDGYSMPWDAGRTLTGIVVSPYAPRWYLDAVQRVVEKFAPGLVERITWSDLRADPNY
jgi:hypothetical protein